MSVQQATNIQGRAALTELRPWSRRKHPQGLEAVAVESTRSPDKTMPKHLKEYLTFHPNAEAEACDQEFDAAAGMAVIRESAATFVQEASFWTESTRYRQWVDAKRANCKALVDGDGQTLVPEERVRM